MKKIFFFTFLAVSAFNLKAQDDKTANNTPVKQWSVVTNPNLKGPNGQIVVVVPGEALMLCNVARASDGKNVFTFHGSGGKELPPGNYDITFRDIKILSVPVEKGKDTRIFAGVLNSTVRGLWEVYTKDSVKIFASGYSKAVALPAGDYTVKTGGAQFKTTINDGKITVFSFTVY